MSKYEAGSEPVILFEAEGVHYHPHGGRTLQIAARSFGVNVGPEEEAFWRAGLTAAAALDDLVDERGVQDLEPAFSAVTNGQPIGAEGMMSDDAAQEVAAVYARLSPARRAAWERCAERLPAYAVQKAGALTVPKLVDVLTGEIDELFVGGLQLDTTGYTDATARAKFNSWLGAFSRVGYLGDTAIDMPKDYARGLVGVTPSLRNRVQVMLAMRPDIPGCLGIGLGGMYQLSNNVLATIRERSR